MTDYYFKAPTAQALIDALSFPDPAPKFRFQANFSNVITPMAAQPEILESTDVDGNIIPGQPARGQEGMFYCCIRSQENIIAPINIQACTAEEAAPVCGVWA